VFVLALSSTSRNCARQVHCLTLYHPRPESYCRWFLSPPRGANFRGLRLFGFTAFAFCESSCFSRDLSRDLTTQSIIFSLLLFFLKIHICGQLRQSMGHIYGQLRQSMGLFQQIGVLQNQWLLWESVLSLRRGRRPPLGLVDSSYSSGVLLWSHARLQWVLVMSSSHTVVDNCCCHWWVFKPTSEACYRWTGEVWGLLSYFYRWPLDIRIDSWVKLLNY
jgi:hypothetical protein